VQKPEANFSHHVAFIGIASYGAPGHVLPSTFNNNFCLLTSDFGAIQTR